MLQSLLRVFLCAAILAGAARAQNITGAILGNIEDPSGSRISGAEVEIVNVETNQATKVRTGDSGLFQANYLRPGTYRVSVSAPGFKRAVREGLTLQVEDRLRVDLRLEVGDTSASVTVEGGAQLVETENASLGQVVSTRTVQDIPIQGRNIFDLVGLSAGVQVNPRAVGGTASTGDVGTPLFVQSDISINGGRFRTNEYLVDGVTIMLPDNNDFAFSPTPDGTQEFKVLTNSFGPQFGRSGGGVINVITRGGTNEYHGVLYEFFRNDRLRANNFFSNSRGQKRPTFHFNQFGAAGGGRIKRDRTFFFAEYQGHRQGSGGGAGILTLPTAAEKRGDFSQSRNRTGDAVIVFNPFSTRPGPGGVGFVRDPFPGNIIPANVQSRVGRTLAGYYPDPNRPGDGPALINNFAWGPSDFANSNQWNVRLDHRLSDKHSLFGRITRNTGDTGTTGPYHNIAENVNGTTVSRMWNGAINYTGVLSPSRILNLRVGATRRFEGRDPLSAGKVNLTSDLGFPSYVAAKVQEQLFPTVAVANYGQLGSNSGDRIRRANEIYTLVAEQSEIHGRHTIVYGADLRLYDQTPFQGGAASGSYSFALSQTQGPDPLRASLNAGNGVASMLLGFGTGSIQSVPALAIRNMYYGLFVNDDIKFRRLTINVGVRWEYDEPRRERYNRFGNFDFNAPFPIQVQGLSNLRGVLKFAGQDGLPSGQNEPTYKDFGPRIGLAYRLRGDSVIRAGYGIFFAPRFGTTAGQNFGTPGYTVNTPWVSSSDGVTPINLLDNPYPNGLLNKPDDVAYRTQLGQSLLVMDRGNIPNNYNQQWNLSVQHELKGGYLVETGYSGNRGVHIPVSYDWNQINPQFQSLGAQLNTQVSNPFFGLTNTGTFALATIARSQLLRPYPQYGSINSNSPAVSQNAGSSTYHALQFRVEKRYSAGYNFVLSYTGSKLIDNGSGRVFGETAFVPPVQNAYNLRGERSLSEGDVSQRLVFSHTLELPFGKGKKWLSNAPVAVRMLTGGWAASGAFSWNTGFPLALTSTGNSGVGSAVLRPNSTGKSAELSGTPQSRLTRFFDTNQFTIPEPFTFGNVSRTVPDVRTPSHVNYNLALQKSFPVRERMAVLFRAETFNLSNTPFFFAPGEGLGGSDFGVIASATGERQVQFSLKLLF